MLTDIVMNGVPVFNIYITVANQGVVKLNSITTHKIDKDNLFGRFRLVISSLRKGALSHHIYDL